MHEIKNYKENYMKDKCVVLITGASSGFGKEVAKDLIKDGYIVYATARRVELMQDLKEMGGKVLKLDVTNTENVDMVVSTIIEEQGQIDVLFNNAGFGVYGSIENVPLEEIEYQFNVNVFGVARMLQAVLPHMREKKSGKIINTASLVSHLSTPIIGWYAATKHALKGMSDALRLELSPIGIDVVLIDPGAVNTGFEEVAMSNLDKINHAPEYGQAVESVKKYVRTMYKKAPGPQSTVRDVDKAVKAKKPSIRYKTTFDSKLFYAVKKIAPDCLVDAIISNQLKLKG
jgi:short-subunit dehydrogenase